MKTKQQQFETREEWLQACIDLFRPAFKAAGEPLRDTIRASCAFPRRSRGKAIGQHWPTNFSSDKHDEIFISPILAEPLRVADVLAHELVHTHHSNHKAKTFGKLARALHLEGKLTATTGGEAFKLAFAGGITALGEYPHGAMNERSKPTGGQSTRLLKCECSECGYLARVTRKWIEAAGAPICPECEKSMGVQS
jgi:hypothetical protein